MALHSFWRGREAKDRDGVVLFAFAFVLLARMALSARLYSYGFYLAAPAMMVVTLLLTERIPRWIEARGGVGAIFRTASLGALLLLAAAHLEVSWNWYHLPRVPVGEGRDRFYADSRGEVVNSALAWLRGNAAAGESLLVLPEGSMLNYLAGLPGSTPFSNLLPVEMMAYGEGRILSSLKSSPPDLIALVERPTGEFGVPYFGADYGRLVMGWIDGQYASVALFGAPPGAGRGFGILFLRKVAGLPPGGPPAF